MVKKNRYQLEPLRELADQQVRFVPREKKIEQARRAESLYREITDSEIYSYRFVCAGITDFKAQRYAGLMFEGKKIKHDLLLLIEDLFDSVNAAAEEFKEKVWTINELCRRFNVSSKTIARWRKSGLVARKFLFGKKKYTGFLNESVEYFVKTKPSRIFQSGNFRQLTAEEKKLIIAVARRTSGKEKHSKPSETVQRLARYLGRSAETIRYTLKHFDERNPDTALFSRRCPLSEKEQQQVFELYLNGIPVKKLTEQFHRTRGTIYRMVNLVRAKKIAELPLSFIVEPDFYDEKDNEKDDTVDGSSKDSPVFVEESAEPPNPTFDERFLFRRMNLLKFKAAALRETLNRVHPKVSVMSQIEALYQESLAVKNEIIAAHLRLVISVAKRHAGQGAKLFDLISDGNLTLLQAAETFDYRRGNRFSTYLTWAITRSFARTISEEKKYRNRFVPDKAEELAEAPDKQGSMLHDENTQWEYRRQVEQLLNLLDEREQKIIAGRFGIGDNDSPSARNKIGSEIGMTGERVRQIELAVLEKLRDSV